MPCSVLPCVLPVLEAGGSALHSHPDLAGVDFHWDVTNVLRVCQLLAVPWPTVTGSVVHQSPIFSRRKACWMPRSTFSDLTTWAAQSLTVSATSSTSLSAACHKGSS